MWNQIIEFLNTNTVTRIILDAYFLFSIVLIILRFVCKNRKALSLVFSLILLILSGYIAISLKLGISKYVYSYVLDLLGVGVIIILAPEIRKALDSSTKLEYKGESLTSSSDDTKTAIADAVMYLASRKIGALITIEKHNSLDQYAEKAIQLNSDVSKELLINIFSPLTPLHDGAVIIRGNKIRCAGAYYVLTQHEDLDKTTGSRHRAGLGISEVTDSLTIIVSEETGNISIATEGFMLKISDRQKLLDYIDMFLK